ncbi:MAG: hypothetical protein IJ692_06660 [Alloprevotella sp.]|nr:hypothetical protein [Alloprevotella sp.]
MKEDWIEQLRNRAADYGEAPPPGVWDDVRDAVNGTASSKPSHKRSRLVWWTIPTAAAACLLLFFTLRHSAPSESALHPSKGEEKALARGEAPENPATTSYAASSAPLAAARPISPASSTGRKREEHAVFVPEKTEILPAKTDILPSEPETPPTAEADVRYADLSEASLEQPQDSTTWQPTERKPPVRSYDLVAQLPDNGSALPDVAPGASSHLSFSVHATRSMGGGGMNAGGPLAYGHSGMAAPVSPASSDYPEPDYWQHEEIEEPFSFGIAVSWQFAKRWRAELGLDYTTLYESYSSSWPRGNSKEMENCMQFVSVPARAHYLLWDRKLLQAYVSAGITAEQCVRNYRDISRTYENGHVGLRREHGVSRPFQFSANMGLGVQFNFNRHFGLYVQSEFGYYVPNGSSDRNYYTEHRKVVKSEVGFRVNLNRMYKNQKP